MRIVSAFAGVGGFDIAFDRAGCEIVAQIENDPACQAVLRRRFPGVPLFGDISTVKGVDLPEFDVLVGGFPCQDLSVAGSRAGLKGERSGLFFEFARLVEETQPTWFVLENVAGLLSSHGGRDMGTLLGTMGELGYWWAYRCLDAQFFGVPQRRRRIFIVGHSRNRASPREVLFEPESGHRHPPKSRTTRSAAPVTRAVTESFGTGGADLAHAEAGWIGAYGGRPEEHPPYNQNAQCVTTGTGKRYDVDTETIVPIGVGTPHPTQEVVGPVLATADGRGYRLGNDTEAAEHLVPTAFSQNGSDVQATGERSACLRGEGSSAGNGGVNVAYSIYPESGQGADLRATECVISPTVSATDGGKSSERGVRIVQAHAVAERGRGDGRNLELGEEGLYNALVAGDGGSSRRQLVTYVKTGSADETSKEERFKEAGPGDPVQCLNASDAHRTRTLVVGGIRKVRLRRRRLKPDERLEAGGAVAFDWQAGGERDKSWRGGARSWVVKQGDYAGSLSTTKVQAVAYKPEEADKRPSTLIGAAGGTVWRRLPVAYRKATKAHYSGDWERWEEAEKADTLASNGMTSSATAVVFEGVDEVAGTLQASSSRCRDGQPGGGGIREGLDRMTYVPHVDAGAQLAVRRLMPVECERLQGFPDGWTDGQVDSHRYRQIGNAVAVPVVEWIARRLVNVHQNPPEEAKSYVASGARVIKVRRKK